MLSDLQHRTLNFLEQMFLLEGVMPDYKLTAETFDDPNLTPKLWKEFFASPEFQQALLRRGLIVTSTAPAKASPSTGLIPKTQVLEPDQLLAANTVLDYNDRRSQSKKLADLGIPTQKWQAWLRQPAFQNYLRSRAELSLTDNLHQVHGGLLDAASRGDTSAMKLYYEMTGRFSSNDNNVNVSLIFIKLIEILQKHLAQQPQVLTSIANELSQLVPGQAAPQSPVGALPILEGELVNE